MGEVVPRVAVIAVVLPDGSPLTLAQVGPEATPRNSLHVGVAQSLALGGAVHVPGHAHHLVTLRWFGAEQLRTIQRPLLSLAGV